MDRSHPRGPVIRLGVAQLEARMPWEHEVVRSSRTTETSSCALRCGRSSMAEPQVVVPLTSVRFRPVTPQRIQFKPLVAEMADATVSESVNI
jgi:hypothetical protein